MQLKTVASTILVVSSALPAWAGPLDPPAGPPASTYKTLAEVEPRIAVNAANTPGDNDATPSLFKITQPGSYYLTANVIGVAGKCGIEIASNAVTLDLMGFSIAGVPGSTDGVLITANMNRGELRNGIVAGWAGNGLNGLPALNFRCTGVQFTQNNGSGLQLGHGATLQDCRANNNGSHGFIVSDLPGPTTVPGGLIVNCQANENAEVGFALGNGCTVTNCTANFNAPGGDSFGGGIVAGIRCTISHCTATNNIGVGISVLKGSTVAHCTAAATAIPPPGTGFGNGIEANGESSVLDCTCSENQGSGIAVFGNCIVGRCGLYRNSENGVRFTGSCLIQGNDIHGNTGAGIRNSGGNDGRIDGNNIVDNIGGGMSFFGTNMLVVRNTARGNGALGNYPPSAGHSFGPIVIVAGVGDFTAVANGNHPLANLSY